MKRGTRRFRNLVKTRAEPKVIAVEAAAPTENDLRTRAIKLYRPPFRHDGHGYIWDADGEMVADDKESHVRVRGWGRIGYLDSAEALHDKVGDLIAEALTKFWEEEREKNRILAELISIVKSTPEAGP